MPSKTPILGAIILMLGSLSLLVNSCRKSGGSIQRTTAISFTVPEGFPEPVYDFSSNPLTQEGFELGRTLFHDNTLAKNYDVTCGSCHQQMAAYTTFDHDLGHGTNHQHTTRNVPGIFNMIWQNEFEWDGRNKSLEQQVLACITAPEKMGETIDEVRARLDTAAGYRELFKNAFGTETISSETLSKALSQFVALIISSNSKYDRVKKGDEQFNASEAAGYTLFKTHCASCHSEPLFTDNSYRNTGLPHRDFHNDAGRMLVTGNPADSLKFKVPSLRNVGITSYYAHDGRFAGISEILDHYTSDKMETPSLDPQVRSAMPLSNLEKFYIQEFLLTLTDSSIVKDTRFE